MSCRLCLRRCQEFKSILEDGISTKIEVCFSINVLEYVELPNKICVDCYRQVEEFYSFRKAILIADKILKKALTDNTLYVFLDENNSQNVNEHTEEYNKYVDGHKSKDVKGEFNANISDSSSQYAFEKITLKSEITDESASEDERIIVQIEGEDQSFDGNIEESENIILEVKNESGETRDVFMCDFCDLAFISQEECMDHEKIHEDDFKCNTCTIVFPTKKELSLHVKSHEVSCPVCSNVMLRSSLRLHMMKHTDRFKCPICSLRSFCKASLDVHIAGVHKKIRNHMCKFCQKAFPSVSALNNHVAIHTNKKKYKCKQCSYRGNTSSALIRHMDMHYGKIHMCELCSKAFKSNQTLDRHKRRVHLKERKFKCTECDRSFFTSFKLKEHVRYHTGEKPFVCKLCGKRFVRKDTLRDHSYVHITPEFACEDCGAEFFSEHKAKKHKCIKTK